MDIDISESTAELYELTQEDATAEERVSTTNNRRIRTKLSIFFVLIHIVHVYKFNWTPLYWKVKGALLKYIEN